MKGDPGPYIEMDGSHVWVPRTVPYLEARRLAHGVAEYRDRVVYRGKDESSRLLGFKRDCLCDEVCELLYDDDGDLTGDDETCVVPSWKFELVEESRD